MEQARGHWGSRLGFVLAAAGSAIGLGNIWKFPYITGENGGGLFVITYLICIAVVGLPIMMAEIFIGRTAQQSPVGAFRALSKPRSPWILSGWIGVVTAFIILSYYSVVAGWAMHYTFLSVKGTFNGMDAETVGATFGEVFVNPGLNVGWHIVFMVITTLIVMGGVRGGVERAAKLLMPILFLMMVALLVHSVFSSGFGQAADFVFGMHAETFSAASVLEALGHAFFTLSLGMGAMITYGSYLQKDDDLVTTSVTVSALDTGIALMACMVIFPIIFTYGMDSTAGPGLVFVSLPIAFGQMGGGTIWATMFFLLLTFAALTSAISLLEVAVSYFVDDRKWSRPAAAIACGGVITIFGIPSALSGGTEFFGSKFQTVTEGLMHLLGRDEGMNWFDLFDYFASNWLLPLGGLLISLFVAWRVGGEVRRQSFEAGTKFKFMYGGWVILLRYVVPIAVLAVFLHLIGVLDYAVTLLEEIGLLEGEPPVDPSAS